MPGDPRTYGLAEQLYDAYAHRLHAYCRVLLGDAAADAVAEVFATAERRGLPRGGDTAMWLYGLARAECERRGALNLRLTGSAARALTDPLARAAAGLRTEQREALLLSAGEWLEVPEISRLLGLAPDTVRDLIRTGRAKLERGVLDALLAGQIRPEHEELIAAFEKGTLAALYARRTGTEPPAALREAVVGSPAEPAPADELLHGVPITARTAHMLHQDTPISGAWAGAEPEEEPPQLVVISEDAPDPHSRWDRRLAGVVGLAACAVVAAGVVAATTVGGTGIVTSGHSLLSPSASGADSRRAPATTDTTGASRLRSDARTASSSATASAGTTPTSAVSPPGVLPSLSSPSAITHPSHPVATPTTPSLPATSAPTTASSSPAASDTPSPSPSDSASSDTSDSPTPSVSP